MDPSITGREERSVGMCTRMSLIIVVSLLGSVCLNRDCKLALEIDDFRCVYAAAASDSLAMESRARARSSGRQSSDIYASPPTKLPDGPSPQREPVRGHHIRARHD